MSSDYRQRRTGKARRQQQRAATQQMTVYPMTSNMRSGKSRYMVRDPKCPDGPHPTRWCKCQTFPTLTEAQQYADQENHDD